MIIVAAIETIDSLSRLTLAGNIYRYSMLGISLYAWWSIESQVLNRVVYFSYIVLYTLHGIPAYLLTGILFGFGGYGSISFEESFLYHSTSYLLCDAIQYTLFYITQINDERCDRYLPKLVH